MNAFPNPNDIFKGEKVIFATGYQVKRSHIRQHLILGGVISLTIIGIVIGIPMLLRGWYLARNFRKTIIITETKFYLYHHINNVFNFDLLMLSNVMWRSTFMGFLELRFVLNNGLDYITKGNFYDNEIQILINILKNQRGLN